MFLKKKYRSLKIADLGPVKTIPTKSNKVQSCVLHVLQFGTHNNFDEFCWVKKKSIPKGYIAYDFWKGKFIAME